MFACLMIIYTSKRLIHSFFFFFLSSNQIKFCLTKMQELSRWCVMVWMQSQRNKVAEYNDAQQIFLLYLCLFVCQYFTPKLLTDFGKVFYVWRRFPASTIAVCKASVGIGRECSVATSELVIIRLQRPSSDSVEWIINCWAGLFPTPLDRWHKKMGSVSAGIFHRQLTRSLLWNFFFFLEIICFSRVV